MSPATDRQVADWLVALGRLTTFNGSAEDAANSIRAYVPELTKRFDARDFNQISREFVARNCRFFPSYGELCELLDKWPKPSEKPALPAPEGSDLDANDRAWVAFWHKRRAEIWAVSVHPRGNRDADMANLMSLVRANSQRAWREVSGVKPEPYRAPSDREVAAVAASLEKFRDRTPKSEIPAPEPIRPQPRYLEGDDLDEIRVMRTMQP